MSWHSMSSIGNFDMFILQGPVLFILQFDQTDPEFCGKFSKFARLSLTIWKYHKENVSERRTMKLSMLWIDLNDHCLFRTYNRKVQNTCLESKCPAWLSSQMTDSVDRAKESRMKDVGLSNIHSYINLNKKFWLFSIFFSWKNTDLKILCHFWQRSDFLHPYFYSNLNWCSWQSIFLVRRIIFHEQIIHNFSVICTSENELLLEKCQKLDRFFEFNLLLAMFSNKENHLMSYCFSELWYSENGFIEWTNRKGISN